MVALSLALPSRAQINPLRQAEKKINQHNWSVARQVLTKVLRKDSLNIEARVLMARWFLNPGNPSYQTDSAYRHIIMALRIFSRTETKEKWKRKQLDSGSLLLLRHKVDSLAFDEAKAQNTEKSYDDFISKHPGATQAIQATELRDEVAFLEAMKQNTYTAFGNFLKRYPSSHRTAEALHRFESLLFESKTKDKKRKSFQQFVAQYPNSPYKKIAEKNIYEVLTASGLPAGFQKFIDENPHNSYVNRAKNILFHLLKEGEEKIGVHFFSDSLDNISTLNQLAWMPFYKNGKFGFMDTHGHETLMPLFDDVSDDYKCQATKEDVLTTANGLYGRNGVLIAPLPGGFKDIGAGFMKCGDSIFRVVHKSGVVIEIGLQDAAVLAGRFLVLKKANRVGLWALNGRPLLPLEFNSISIFDEIIVADRNGKKNLYTTDQMESLADGVPLDESFVFDRVKKVGQNLWVSNGSLEGILNSKLEYVVPLARQSLQLTPFGLVRLINDRFVLEGLGAQLQNRPFVKFRFYKQWIQLKTEAGEQLFDVQQKKIIETQSDSIWFLKGLAFSKRSDSICIHINSFTRLEISARERIVFVPSSDSIRYFYVQQKTKKNIFDLATGEKLFSTEADKIESLGAQYLIITKKNKKGMIDRQNRPILPIEYNALISSDARLVSLFKDKKFGLYDLASRHMIKPTYGKNVVQLLNQFLIVYKEGHYGVVDWQQKVVVPFLYDEIQPWSAKEIWVRLGFEWRLYNFVENRPVLRLIKNFRMIKDNADEKLAVVQQENYFGVVSSKSGIIISPTFSSVENHGRDEEPVYVTHKEIEEAGIVVVIYYDHNGKLLRKQVYEENEFTKLNCPEN
ncbi:MAG: WG repeat-containing protein [Bacteroidetes bacterium]|nr:WG repeat-containing protein [Bacteroidota bacterium]